MEVKWVHLLVQNEDFEGQRCRNNNGVTSCLDYVPASGIIFHAKQALPRPGAPGVPQLGVCPCRFLSLLSTRLIKSQSPMERAACQG